MEPVSPRPTPPQRGSWKGVELLQNTGDAHVWLAENGARKGILKIAKTENGQTAIARESTLLRKVDHPFIPALVSASDEKKWMVREYVAGSTLSADQKLSLGQIVQIGSEIAAILSAIHSLGLIHADLKPENIILDEDGHAHLLDFGIACKELSKVKPGEFRGTLGYAAPEQLQGQALGPQTDIYSLGVLLYTLLSGHLPYSTEDPAALAYLPLATLPNPISLHRPALPSALDDLVMQCLVREPCRRPQSGLAFSRALQQSLTTHSAALRIGMPVARSSLRSLVAVAVRGQGGVVVVYGKAGTGRNTIIEEALECGKREGLPKIDTTEQVNHALNQTLLEEVVLYVGAHDSPEDVALASRILSDRLPCLMFLRSTEPLVVLERRGARHVVPERLAESEIETWLSVVGRPVEHAAAIYRRTKGHPGRIVAALEIQNRAKKQLSAVERELLARASESPIPVDELSRQLQLKEHAVVDIAENLVDMGLLEIEDRGHSVVAKPIES